MIYGQPGTCKTTFVAALAGSLATGNPLFGRTVHRPGSTVYMAMEDPAGFNLRMTAWKSGAGLALESPIGVYTFPCGLDLRDEKLVHLFEQFLREKTFSQSLECIVVDTYAAATPGANENSAEDTTRALAHAQSWKERLGVTVLLVHHANAAGSRERGHSAMRGAADTMIVMAASEKGVSATCEKQRNGPPFPPFLMRLDAVAGACVLVPAVDTDGLGGRPTATEGAANEAKALAVLSGLGGARKWVRRPPWRDAAGIPESSFYRVVKRLQDAGLIKTNGREFRMVDPGRQGREISWGNSRNSSRE